MTKNSSLDLVRARAIDNMCVSWRSDFWKPKHLWLPFGITDEERQLLRHKLANLWDNHLAPVLQAYMADAERYATLMALAMPMDVTQWENHDHGWRIDLIGDGELEKLINQIIVKTRIIRAKPTCSSCHNQTYPTAHNPQHWYCLNSYCNLHKRPLTLQAIAASHIRRPSEFE